MPLWIWLLGGGILAYLVTQSASSQAATASTTGTSTGGGGDDNLPTPQSSVATPLTIGQSTTVAAGTKLFSDSKLSQAWGSVDGTAPLTVTVTGTGVASDGSVSVSYVNAGTTVWFQQSGT